jgi:hypothetical protein
VCSFFPSLQPFINLELLQVVIDKSVSDDELIDALRKEVARLKAAQKSALAVEKANATAVIDPFQRDFDSNKYQSEITRLQRLCKNQVLEFLVYSCLFTSLFESD